MRRLSLILAMAAGCRPAALPTAEVHTDAPLPKEPPAPVVVDPPPKKTPAVKPAPEVEPTFASDSPDAARDPFRSDSVDDNREGEHILERALTPPAAENPTPGDASADAPDPGKKPAAP